MGHALIKTRPIHLTLFVTRRCNANCPFCFYLKKETEGQERGKELSLDEIERFSRTTGPLLWLSLSGGEVFLREDLVEICRAFYANSTPSITLLSTNGMMPEVIREKTEAILGHLKESTVAVKLSLDGVGEAHDRMRATPGSFERVMKTYGLLGGLLDRYPNFELGINTVLTAENEDMMDEVIDFVGRLDNIKTHTISLVRGELGDKSFKQLDIKNYERAARRLEEGLASGAASTYRFRGARLKAAQDIIQRKLILKTLREDRRVTDCYAGTLNVVVTETGDVYPCETLDRKMGSLRESGYDLKRVIKSPEAKEVIEHIRAGRCHCTHECFMMTNILFNPAKYPALLKEYLRLR